MTEFVTPLAKLNQEWGELTMQIGTRALGNPEEMGGAAMDYLMYSGYVALAYLWARAALAAQKELQSGGGDKEFYQAKVQTAQFYFRRILPRTLTLNATIKDGVDALMAMEAGRISSVE
jgi:hypothetical protein